MRRVSFSVLTPTVVQQKDMAHKNMNHLSTKVIFWNKWIKKTQRNLSIQVHLENAVEKVK